MPGRGPSTSAAQRRRHKTATVFLHEIGHTLGAPHEVDATTIMHGRYGSKVTGYSDAAAGLMRLALAHRLDPGAQSEQAFAGALLAHVEGTSVSWVPDERDALLARLRREASPPPSPPPTRGRRRSPTSPAPSPPDPPAGPAPDPLATLTITDRHAYDHAVEHLHARRLADAWVQAQPLFTAYPDVAAVQDLRCQIAMARGGDWTEVQAQCAPLMSITKTPGDKRRAP